MGVASEEEPSSRILPDPANDEDLQDTVSGFDESENDESKPCELTHSSKLEKRKKKPTPMKYALQKARDVLRLERGKWKFERERLQQVGHVLLNFS